MEYREGSVITEKCTIQKCCNHSICKKKGAWRWGVNERETPPYFYCLIKEVYYMDYEDSIRCSPTGIVGYLPAGKATKAYTYIASLCGGGGVGGGVYFCIGAISSFTFKYVLQQNESVISS
jgi:hypothetical protein